MYLADLHIHSKYSRATEVVKEFGLQCPPRRFLNEVSAYKNGKGECNQAIAAYCARLRERGAADYDDLISLALQQKVKTFGWLHVDEFQDVNPMQYELVRQWIGETGRLFVIGDPDQAIYSFRGAASDCFERLQKEYPDASVIRLKESYRSAPQILQCAEEVIFRSGGARSLLPVRKGGAKVRVAECASALSEGIFMAKEIARMVGGLDMLGKGREEKLRTFGEIAVLARTHRVLGIAEQCLRKEGIPCLTASDGAFLEAPEVSGTPSPFLAELPEGVAKEMAAPKPTYQQLSLF